MKEVDPETNIRAVSGPVTELFIYIFVQSSIVTNTFACAPGIKRSNKAWKRSQYTQILKALRLNNAAKSKSVEIECGNWAGGSC